jgi:hypothetical protein
MGTSDVRLDPKLNQQIWSQGIKNVPHRLRLKLERRRNDDEGAKEKLYTYASWVPVDSFKVRSPVFFLLAFRALTTSAPNRRTYKPSSSMQSSTPTLRLALVTRRWTTADSIETYYGAPLLCSASLLVRSIEPQMNMLCSPAASFLPGNLSRL